MSGAGLTLTDDLTGALQSLARGLTQPRDLLANIGELLVQSTRERILSERSPSGATWPALHPLYAAGKRGPGKLREAGMDGGLMGSITWQTPSATALEVGTNKIYAAVHQFGAVIRPKTAARLVFEMGGLLIHALSVTIPAREYLGISDDDQADMLDLATDYLSSLVGQRIG